MGVSSTDFFHYKPYGAGSKYPGKTAGYREACLRSVSGKLYHMGLRGKVARSTLADAHESHDGRI